jgi:hypothetical protein
MSGSMDTRFSLRAAVQVSQKLLHTILSISGFIPEHMTAIRAFAMLASVVVSVAVFPNYRSVGFALAHFLASTVVYLGFIWVVLPEKGMRLRMIRALGEQRAYLCYEGFLAFAFFHNGVALSLITRNSAGSGFWGSVPQLLIMAVFLALFVTGLGVKVWSAYAVGIPIYYWKDMFVGRMLGEFVVTGPYRYLRNPMYGLGQAQVYAMAIYWNSLYGIIFGAINQLLVYLFYFTVERPFVNRTYLGRQ